MVLLVQEMVYSCNLGEEDECRKKEILVVSDQLVPEEVKQRKEMGCNIPKVLEMQKSFSTNTVCDRLVLGSRRSSVQAWQSARPCLQLGFSIMMMMIVVMAMTMIVVMVMEMVLVMVMAMATISKTQLVTRFPHCDCIQLGYSVHAVAKVGRVLILMKAMSIMKKLSSADENSPQKIYNPYMSDTLCSFKALHLLFSVFLIYH